MFLNYITNYGIDWTAIIYLNCRCKWQKLTSLVLDSDFLVQLWFWYGGAFCPPPGHYVRGNFARGHYVQGAFCPYPHWPRISDLILQAADSKSSSALTSFEGHAQNRTAAIVEALMAKESTPTGSLMCLHWRASGTSHSSYNAKF